MVEAKAALSKILDTEADTGDQEIREELMDYISHVRKVATKDEIDIIREELKHQDMVREEEERWAKRQKKEEDTDDTEVAQNMEFARRIVQISKTCPVRLNEAERIIWNILESSLQVSEYTDKIDVFSRGNKSAHMTKEIQSLCSIVAGLVVAHSFEKKSLESIASASVYQKIFELGRRVKVLNPSMMRGTYGKLMWMLMDSSRDEVQRHLSMDLTDCHVVTVYDRLIEDRNTAEKFLRDSLLETAVSEIDPVGKTREEIEIASKAKAEALATLKKRYGVAKDPGELTVTALLKSYGNLPSDDRPMCPSEVEILVKSLSDYNSYVTANVRPVEKMLTFLDDFFEPDRPKNDSYCLQISSKLRHSHSTQFRFVCQSLTLWKGIMRRMLDLWQAAEQDMLQQRYRLQDTGQGLNRVQSAPTVAKKMGTILRQTQEEILERGQQWVGLSVVHLGDRDVPNALFFIDKYTQVPRILGPLAHVIESIPKLADTNASLKQYVEQFGGVEGAQRLILRDFFRYGFDGDGDDGGSCVDGRLTSCWNWCSKIEKKKYFPLFLLCGFQGFDG